MRYWILLLVALVFVSSARADTLPDLGGQLFLVGTYQGLEDINAALFVLLDPSDPVSTRVFEEPQAGPDDYCITTGTSYVDAHIEWFGQTINGTYIPTKEEFLTIDQLTGDCYDHWYWIYCELPVMLYGGTTSDYCPDP